MGGMTFTTGQGPVPKSVADKIRAGQKAQQDKLDAMNAPVDMTQPYFRELARAAMERRLRASNGTANALKLPGTTTGV